MKLLNAPYFLFKDPAVNVPFPPAETLWIKLTGKFGTIF